jgi:hypothetical protein
MPFPRRFTIFGILFVVMAAVAGGAAWMFRTPVPTPEEIRKEQNDVRVIKRNVELKDSSLAELENRNFREAEPQLLELATMGMKEQIGARNWLINRIALIGTIDEAKDITAYAEANDRARTALDLEWNVEHTSPVRFLLAARLAFLSQNIPKQIEYLRSSAARGEESSMLLQDLYRAERNATDDSYRKDGEDALKSLYEFIPDNTYVALEWLQLQARKKDATIVTTLERAHDHLLPFLSDVPADSSVAPDRSLSGASTAAKAGDWSAVERDLASLSKIASPQPAVRNDKARVDRGLLWLIKTDFSDKFYHDHPFDRVLPKTSIPVHFTDETLPGPLAELGDVRDARGVDFDRDGRLDIAVLRTSSLEVYGRSGPSAAWSKLAATPLPGDGFEHLLAANLERDATSPRTDFLAFGPAGVLVVEGRAGAGGKPPSLRTVESSGLLEKTKGAEAVVTVDLDQDGALDLVVARNATGTKAAAGGAISVWRNVGRTQFTDVTGRSGLGQALASAGALVALDWNHDFDIDVLSAGTSAAPAGVALLRGAGEGRFRFEKLGHDNPVFQQATALALLDADANGCCDVMAASPNGIALLRTSSTEPGEVNVLSTETISDFPARRLLVVDYDNDGFPDVIAWNGEAVRAFHGAGNGRFEPAEGILPANLNTMRAADCGDFDADGDLDLLAVVPEGSGGRLRLLKNEGGNANNWIDVSLNGGPAGVGIGSTLQLKSSVVSQAQVVSGPVTHFGIGSLGAADILRIVWPDGVPADILQPAKNKVLRASPPKGGWR